MTPIIESSCTSIWTPLSSSLFDNISHISATICSQTTTTAFLEVLSPLFTLLHLMYLSLNLFLLLLKIFL